MGYAYRSDEDKDLAVAFCFPDAVVGAMVDFFFVVVLVVLCAYDGPLGWKTL
jgi:hypothetical protein